MLKEQIISIDDRGNSLTFKIKEMPSYQLFHWLNRTVLAIVGTGFLNSPGAHKAREAAQNLDTLEALQAAGSFLSDNGMAALASLDYEKAKSLTDELLPCCYVMRDGFEQQLTPETVGAVIFDVSTLYKLYKEALAFNLSFFGQGGLFKSATGEKSPGSPKPKISVRS